MGSGSFRCIGEFIENTSSPGARARSFYCTDETGFSTGETAHARHVLLVHHVVCGVHEYVVVMVVVKVKV